VLDFRSGHQVWYTLTAASRKGEIWVTLWLFDIEFPNLHES
jgi:hypothetical protein